ncbi:MAG: hypothetical protein ACHQUA_01265 [Microgenomates group bacterium]
MVVMPDSDVETSKKAESPLNDRALEFASLSAADLKQVEDTSEREHLDLAECKQSGSELYTKISQGESVSEIKLVSGIIQLPFENPTPTTMLNDIEAGLAYSSPPKEEMDALFEGIAEAALKAEDKDYKTALKAYSLIYGGDILKNDQVKAKMTEATAGQVEEKVKLAKAANELWPAEPKEEDITTKMEPSNLAPNPVQEEVLTHHVNNEESPNVEPTAEPVSQPTIVEPIPAAEPQVAPNIEPTHVLTEPLPTPTETTPKPWETPTSTSVEPTPISSAPNWSEANTQAMAQSNETPNVVSFPKPFTSDAINPNTIPSQLPPLDQALKPEPLPYTPPTPSLRPVPGLDNITNLEPTQPLVQPEPQLVPDQPTDVVQAPPTIENPVPSEAPKKKLFGIFGGNKTETPEPEKLAA